MNKTYTKESAVIGVFILAGLISLGYFIYKGVYQIKAADRYVTVKGLAERTAEADNAVWPISFKVTDDDLLKMYTEITKKSETVVSFLMKNGFMNDEISISPPEIKDMLAEQYYNDRPKSYRYIGKMTITVNTENVKLVLSTRKNLSELVKNGIALSSDYDDRAQFTFTRLNKIKPDMIEKATLNARKAALKFAGDSGSKLGNIKKAWQGQFVISDRDSNTPYIKKIRVVSTLQYFLVD